MIGELNFVEYCYISVTYLPTKTKAACILSRSFYSKPQDQHDRRSYLLLSTTMKRLSIIVASGHPEEKAF